MRNALLGLPVRQRTALVLRVVYGLSFDELGEALGISADAAKMTLSRGRERFRTRYMAGDSEHEDR
jgi:RNA polymerase sigma factor (sigma-70 family)